MRFQNSKFHFVGIGGIGMCGLAELLHRMGAHVSGSDMAENAQTHHLKSIGVQVYIGHQGDHVGAVDVVVYSSAISKQNPEIRAARQKGIPLIPRAEALAEIMRLKRGIAIAGTHGKTTTTSLISSIFLEGGLEPTIAVGGKLQNIGSTAVLGKGEWCIAEADESDGSFHKLSPEIAVITNIDSDHLEHYGTFDNLKKAFLDFALKVPFYGKVIVCGDDPVIESVFSDYPKQMITYGFNPTNDYQLKGEMGSYEILRSDKKSSQLEVLGDIQIEIPGRHNALNALAATIVGLTAGIKFAQCQSGLLNFKGVDRRFQLKGEKKQILIYDDYGHHPTEVTATLAGFKEKFPHQRLVVLFQPHRYSRTQTCWAEFLKCFAGADVLLLTDIYPAGENPLPGIDSKILCENINHPNRKYLPKNDNLSDEILRLLQPGDIFLTLGAGDGWKIGQKVLESL
ncbi:MAG: UDP-N-acetylmuramate--L-alanine ligase [Bdellovibrionales bacterium]